MDERRVLADGMEGQEEAVERLLALPRADALAALRDLGQSRSQEAARVLVAYRGRTGEKALRKAAGRALAVLDAAGIDVAGLLGQTAAQAPQPASPEEAEAWVTAIDAGGSRLVALLQRAPGRGTCLVRLVVNDVVGVKACGVLERLTREEVDELRRRLPRGEDGLRYVPVPAAYARHLVTEAAALNEQSGYALSGSFAEWRGRLLDEGSEPMPPLIYREPLTQEVREHRLRWQRESAELLDEPEMAPWIFDPRTLEPFAVELRELERSPLVTAHAVRAERRDRILRRAAARVLEGGGRARLARRLAETAYLFLRTGREDAARRALAAALGLEAETPRLEDHPFLRDLLLRSLEVLEEARRNKTPLTEIFPDPAEPVD